MVYVSPYPALDIPETNIVSYLFSEKTKLPSKPIWLDAKDPTRSLTLAQALSWIKRLAIFLEENDVLRGEVVMILTPNHIFVPVAYLGIVGAGRVFSAASPNYTITEIEHQIKDTRTRLVLTHPSLLENAIEASRRNGLGNDRIFQFSDRPCAPSRGIQDWRDVPLSTNDYTWDSLGTASKRTLATINYSSGTTGPPKGVCVTHFNIIANSVQTIYMRDQEHEHSSSPKPEERWLGFLPLYHAYGKLFSPRLYCF
jgi:acyl-CoA synthetase (AMP-forming)/AMP-acid ligase II